MPKKPKKIIIPNLKPARIVLATTTKELHARLEAERKKRKKKNKE